MTSEEAQRIRTVYESRKDQYKGAEFRYAIVRKEGDNLFLRGLLAFTNEKPPVGESRDYGKLLLGHEVLSADAGYKLVKALLDGHWPSQFDFTYPGDYQVRLPHRHREGLPVQSYDRHLGNEWPLFMVYLESRTQRVGGPSGPLVKAELPLFRNADKAIESWLGVVEAPSELQNGIGISFPDYRARIAEITFYETSIAVRIEAGGIDPDRLIAKVGLGSEYDYMEPKVTRKRDSFVVSTEGVPSYFDVYLLDGQKDDLIDWQTVYMSWTDLPSNVHFAVPEQRLTHLIDAGESETVEFKRELGGGDEFVESVVAFANSGGGTIFLGVDDRGTVVGVDNPQKERERVFAIVESNCEPTPPLDTDLVTLRGTEVLLVRVTTGTNPPYVHRGRGVVYVRRGATDRPAKRTDLDEIYGRKSGLGGWRG